MATAKRKGQLARLVGKRIRALREERGWAQVDLAAHIDERAKQPTISAFEAGKRFPAQATLEALASAFDVHVVELFLDPAMAQEQLAIRLLRCRDASRVKAIAKLL